MVGFTESLEKKAEQIASDVGGHAINNSIPSILKNKIALAVDQIKRLKGFHQNQNSRFSKVESDVGTEILRLEDRLPKYSLTKCPEREKFQKQLIGIKSERRKEESFYEDKLQGLHRHLLELVQKYEQIKNIENGNRQYSPKTRAFDAKPGSTLEQSKRYKFT